MQKSDAVQKDIDSFQLLLTKVVPVRNDPIFFYPQNALQRIRGEQMGIFYEECVKDGLVAKGGEGYTLTQKGTQAVQSGDASLIVSPYFRAKKRINLLYVDVLI